MAVDIDPQALAAAALDGLRDLGLPWTATARRLRARMLLVDGMPDAGDDALLSDPGWLIPYLTRARTAADLRALDLTEPLKALIGWDGQRRLDEAAPAHFTTPLGRRVPIDYDAETPTIEARLQELLGVTRSGRQAGRGHDRPAGLLGRGLCRGQEGNARPLSAPSLARGSDRRRPDPARQAARHLTAANANGAPKGTPCSGKTGPLRA